MRERVKKGAVLIAVGASALTMFAADAQADWTRPVKPHGDFYLKRGVVIMTVHYKAPGGWRKAHFHCIGDGCDFHYTRRIRPRWLRLATISELDRRFRDALLGPDHRPTLRSTTRNRRSAGSESWSSR